jgi:hypothetical protein
VATVFSEYNVLLRNDYLTWIHSGAGGLIATIAQKHLQPVEVLTRKSRETLERERTDWSISCYAENLNAFKGKTAVRSLGSNGAAITFNPYADIIANLGPESDCDRSNQESDSRGSGIPVIENSDEGITVNRSPIYSEESQESSEKPFERIGIDHGCHYNEVSAFPSTVMSPDDLGIVDGSAELDLGDLGAYSDSDDMPPVRTRRRKRQVRARRAKSDAVRPAKTFVIRFKEPIAVPVRDETSVDTPDLPSAPTVY